MQNADKYQEWKTKTCPNLIDLLKELPSLKIPASLLLSQLPLLDKRLYSISSSLDKLPGQIHLTLAVVKYSTPGEFMEILLVLRVDSIGMYVCLRSRCLNYVLCTQIERVLPNWGCAQTG